MSPRKILFIFTLIALTSLMTAAQTTWTPEMQLKVKGIGSPRVSPDATRVVYTVSNEMMTADKSEYVTQIWLAGVDGK